MSLKIGLKRKIGISRAFGGFVGLLDQPFAQGATAAYSLRLLRAKHSGGLIRVRADDAGTNKGEADVLPLFQPDGSKIIELNSPIENLNTKAQNRLGAPAGGGDKVFADLVDAGGQNFDAFNSKWYGQTINKNDGSQDTATNQPQIVSSGSIIKENGKPILEATSSDVSLEVPTTDFTMSSMPFTFFIVGKLGGTAGSDNNRYFIDSIIGNDRINTVSRISSDFKLYAEPLYSGAQIKPFDNNQHIFTTKLDSGDAKVHIDGAQEFSDTKTGTLKMEGLTLFNYHNLTYAKDNRLSEVIIYNSDQSSNRTNIETNINNYYSIY